MVSNTMQMCSITRGWLLKCTISTDSCFFRHFGFTFAKSTDENFWVQTATVWHNGAEQEARQLQDQFQYKPNESGMS